MKNKSFMEEMLGKEEADKLKDRQNKALFGSIKLKIDDKVIDYKDNVNYSLENDSTNIALSHHEKTGFGVSVFNKERNIIKYFNEIDGELVLESVEDVLTGKESEDFLK